MLKKTYLSLLLFFILTLFILPAYSQDIKGTTIPSGMELIKVGELRIYVPKGTRLQQKGSLLLIEGLSEYSARRFSEFEEHFARLENRQDELKQQQQELGKQIGQLMKTIETLQKSIVTLTQEKVKAEEIQKDKPEETEVKNP